MQEEGIWRKDKEGGEIYVRWKEWDCRGREHGAKGRGMWNVYVFEGVGLQEEGVGRKEEGGELFVRWKE